MDHKETTHQDEDDVLRTITEPEPQAAATATADEKSDLLEELAALDLLQEDKPFADLDELFGAEHAEKLGREFDWPAMPGAKLQIAHFSAAIDKKNELEDRYRRRKNKLPGERLAARVEERIWEEAMLGTVVKGWSGLRRGGYDYPFTEANYRALMRVRRFRSAVLEIARDSDRFRERADEDLRGNWPAV